MLFKLSKILFLTHLGAIICSAASVVAPRYEDNDESAADSEEDVNTQYLFSAPNATTAVVCSPGMLGQLWIRLMNHVDKDPSSWDYTCSGAHTIGLYILALRNNKIRHAEIDQDGFSSRTGLLEMRFEYHRRDEMWEQCTKTLWNNYGAGNLGDILHDFADEGKVNLPYNFPERGTPWAVYNLGQIGDMCKYMMGDVMGCDPGANSRVVDSGLLENPPPRICVFAAVDLNEKGPFGRTCYPQRPFYPPKDGLPFDPLKGSIGSRC